MALIENLLIAAISSAIGGAAQGATTPDPADVSAGLPSGGGSDGAFALPIPKAGAGPGMSAGLPINLAPQAAVTEQLAQVLAAQGPPPTVPLLPGPQAGPPVGGPGSPGSPQQGPPAPKGPQQTPPAAPSIGEVLMSSPEALTAVAGLLGLGPQQQPIDRAAPIPGGTQGNVVPGLGLPQTSSIGQLLSQIPRLR